MRHIHKRMVLKPGDPKCARDHLLLIHRFNTALDILVGFGKPGVYQSFAWWDRDTDTYGETTKSGVPITGSWVSAVDEMEDALTDVLTAFGYGLSDGAKKVGEVKTPAKQKVLVTVPKSSKKEKKS